MENITFDSQPFSVAKAMLDGSIEGVLRRVFDGDFESGEITLKITLAIDEASTTLEDPDDPDGKPYFFKRPSIKSVVTTTLKQVAKEEATYEPYDIEVREYSDGILLSKIPSNQISIDDIMED